MNFYILQGIDLFQHGEPAYALRIYCAACGEQLQGKTIEQETVGTRTNFPTIVTDAEGGMQNLKTRTIVNSIQIFLKHLSYLLS
mgnify:CR=1 FL=1